MASKLGLSYKRAPLVERLTSAQNKLRSRGVDVGPQLKPHRDPGVQELNELEQTTVLMEAAVQRIDELMAEKASAEKAIEVAVENTRKEILAEIEAAKSAKSQDTKK